MVIMKVSLTLMYGEKGIQGNNWVTRNNLRRSKLEFVKQVCLNAKDYQTGIRTIESYLFK